MALKRRNRHVQSYTLSEEAIERIDLISRKTGITRSRVVEAAILDFQGKIDKAIAQALAIDGPVTHTQLMNVELPDVTMFKSDPMAKGFRHDLD